MGLSADPNKTIKIPSNKIKLNTSSNQHKEWEEVELKAPPKSNRLFVAETLESIAKAPRPRLFRLPKSQVEWITYLMDKYGKDYRAMSSDRKNYKQETWKQIRAKIKRFKSIPEQYNVYLKSKGLTGEEDGSESDLTDGEL